LEQIDYVELSDDEEDLIEDEVEIDDDAKKTICTIME